MPQFLLENVKKAAKMQQIEYRGRMVPIYKLRVFCQGYKRLVLVHCKDCQSENIESRVEQSKIAHNGGGLSVPVHYSVCLDCGREFVPKNQILQNEGIFRKAKEGADGQRVRQYESQNLLHGHEGVAEPQP